MASSRRMISVTTVVLVLGLLGGGIWWRLGSEAESSEEVDGAGQEEVSTEASPPAAQPSASTFAGNVPDPAEGAPAVRDTLWSYVHASGAARAVLIDTLAALVDGTVRGVSVIENRAVVEGQVLLEIDTTELALEVSRLRADVLARQADYDILTMFDDVEIDDAGPRGERAEVARASSGLTAARVALAEAERQLSRATVRAPFAGRIADLVVSPGQELGVGDDLMTVVGLDPIDIEANVLESAIPDLVEGRAAEVRFAAFPGETFTGRIRSVNPVVSAERRAVRVVVRMSNPGGRIKPGMYARVQLQARAHPDLVMVPRSAILERGVGERRTMLFVFEDGLAKWRYVTVGPENERFAAILPSEETDMVEAGEIVLTDGHHYMAHDTRVRLVESVFAAGGRPGR